MTEAALVIGGMAIFGVVAVLVWGGFACVDWVQRRLRR